MERSDFVERTACPVCGRPAAAPFYRCSYGDQPVRGYVDSHYADQGSVPHERLAAADYALCDCVSCGTIFQRTVPDGPFLGAIYNEMITPEPLAALDRSRLTLDAFADRAGELMQLFARIGKPPGAISMLDFGFGHGRYARIARAMGADVYVTEFGTDKHETARALGLTVLEDDELAGRRFDLVHTEQVFEHLVDPAKEFARLAALTAGLLKIAVPRHGDVRADIERHGLAPVSPFAKQTAGRPLTGYEQNCMAAQPIEHLNVFSRRGFEHLAEVNGLRLVGHQRRRDVMLRLGSGRRRTFFRLAQELVKTVYRADEGYYLFTPVR